MSASLDLPDARWEFVQLSGAWARENHVVERRLRPGRQSVGSDRGVSSHQHNPFVALRRATTTEEAGEVYGFSLVYSGNFLAEAEVDAYEATRVRLGISPETFAWTLEPGDAFVDARGGPRLLGCRARGDERRATTASTGSGWRAVPGATRRGRCSSTTGRRPTSASTRRSSLEIATSARDLGVELFVLDDGWFGQRDSDDSSLGDWFVDRRKLPNGLDGLAAGVEALGLTFGLWIEPEMVSERSELFAAHPDWAVGVPGRPRTESRQQLVLDMSRGEVVDHLFDVLSEVLSSAPIAYVKWDMNRNITEPYSAALAGRPPGRVLPSLRPGRL